MYCGFHALLEIPHSGRTSVLQIKSMQTLLSADPHLQPPRLDIDDVCFRIKSHFDILCLLDTICEL